MTLLPCWSKIPTIFYCHRLGVFQAGGHPRNPAAKHRDRDGVPEPKFTLIWWVRGRYPLVVSQFAMININIEQPQFLTGILLQTNTDVEKPP